jgi:8-oxo-dGTP pyrophosphatase MutT (NUDIX family)
MKALINKTAWRELLSAELPGEKAQMEMAPDFRDACADESAPIPAAVLILMYPLEEGTRLVFMKRNAYDGPHSAQVSFPGGAREAGDRTLEDTAIRETREELGIDQEICILGPLTPLHIPVSNYQVSPFAGWMSQRPVFQPDPSEVQYLIEVQLDELMDPAIRLEEYSLREGQEIRVPYFRVGKEKIWGATAMMLSEFLQLASRMQELRC